MHYKIVKQHPPKKPHCRHSVFKYLSRRQFPVPLSQPVMILMIDCVVSLLILYFKHLIEK